MSATEIRRAGCLGVGQAFVYNITAPSPDLPYGDRLELIASALPGWLWLVDAARWPAGLYLCRFVSRGKTQTQYLMVNKQIVVAEKQKSPLLHTKGLFY